MSTHIATGLASLGSNIGALEFKSIKIISKTILNLFAISGGAMMSVSSSAMIETEESQYPFIEMDVGSCSYVVDLDDNISIFSVVDGMVTKPISNFQPLDFNSEFGQKIIEGFNSFTGEAREVIIQQLEGLRAECEANGVKVLLGQPEDVDKFRIGAVLDDSKLIKGKYLKIFISQKIVEKEMNMPIYFMIKNCDNSINIGARILKDLVGDDIGKCAAYILVHEFSHVHSALHLSEGIKDDILELKAYGATKEYAGFIEKYGIPENLKEAIKTLFEVLGNYGDDYRNTMGIVAEGNDPNKRIPGEFELLDALHPGIIRLYGWSLSEFSKDKSLDLCKQFDLFYNELDDNPFSMDLAVEEKEYGNRKLEIEIEECFKKILKVDSLEKNDEGYIKYNSEKKIKEDDKLDILKLFNKYKKINDLKEKIKTYKKSNDSVVLDISLIESNYKNLLINAKDLLKRIGKKEKF